MEKEYKKDKYCNHAGTEEDPCECNLSAKSEPDIKDKIKKEIDKGYAKSKKGELK